MLVAITAKLQICVIQKASFEPRVLESVSIQSNTTDRCSQLSFLCETYHDHTVFRPPRKLPTQAVLSTSGEPRDDPFDTNGVFQRMKKVFIMELIKTIVL